MKGEQARFARERRWREGKRSLRRKNSIGRERKREEEVEEARRETRGRTGITRTITWLFLAVRERALLFSTFPPLLYATGAAFPCLVHTRNTSIHLALSLNGNVIASLLKVGSTPTLSLSLLTLFFRFVRIADVSFSFSLPFPSSPFPLLLSSFTWITLLLVSPASTCSLLYLPRSAG